MFADNVPLTVNPVTVLNNTLKVPPVLFVYVNVLLEYVAPVTNMSVLPVKNPLTLNVPPVLLVNVALPFEYVPPVTLISVGKFK